MTRTQPKLAKCHYNSTKTERKLHLVWPSRLGRVLLYLGVFLKMLKRIISGGQTGADQAALAAAYDQGIETGGWCSNQWLTEDGPAPWLEEKYGLKECLDPGYPIRTIQNIRDSDGTVLFGNTESPGSKLAIKNAKLMKKPILHARFTTQPTPEDLAAWIDEWSIEILNVGGNRASKNKAVYTLTYTTLAKTIEILRQPIIELP